MTLTQPPPETLKADPIYRRTLFIWYGIGIAVISAIIYWGVPAIKHSIFQLSFPEAYRRITLVLDLLLLLFSPAAVYLIVTGRKILLHDAMPYPGQKVIHDTKILRGKAARWRAKSLIALGSGFLGLMIVGMISMHWVTEWFIGLFT